TASTKATAAPSQSFLRMPASLPRRERSRRPIVRGTVPPDPEGVPADGGRSCRATVPQEAFGKLGKSSPHMMRAARNARRGGCTTIAHDPPCVRRADPLVSDEVRESDGVSLLLVSYLEGMRGAAASPARREDLARARRERRLSGHLWALAWLGGSILLGP